MEKSALIILAEGFEETEAVVPIDLLRRAKVGVTIAGLSGNTVISGRNVTLCADGLLITYAKAVFDAIILPGGMPGTTNLVASSLVIDLVKRHNDQKKLVAAICAAPTVLGKAGILAGKKATSYPGYEDALGCKTYLIDPVVRDEHIITSRGAGTALPFALALISYLCGDETAQKIAQSIVFKA